MNDTYGVNYGAKWKVGDRIYICGYAKKCFGKNYESQCKAPEPLTVTAVEPCPFSSGTQQLRVVDAEGSCFGPEKWSSIWFRRWEE